VADDVVVFVGMLTGSPLQKTADTTRKVRGTCKNTGTTFTGCADISTGCAKQMPYRLQNRSNQSV